MAAYIAAVFYATMVIASLIMDVAFTGLGLVPQPNPNIRVEMTSFDLNYTFWLNLIFGAFAVYLFWLNWKYRMHHALLCSTGRRHLSRLRGNRRHQVSQWTLCRREMDSNPRSPVRGTTLFETTSRSTTPAIHLPRQRPAPSGQGPKVRISPSAAESVNCVGCLGRVCMTFAG